MKKLFLFYFLLIVFKSSNAQTNVYHPFPDSNAIWNYEMQMICFGGGYTHDYYSIVYTGDTIIGPYNYHRLGTPYVNHFQQGNCGSATTGSGFIRQDTLLKKVFLMLPPDTTEQLLYDFTMQVGDTVRGYIGSYAFPQNIVYAIDSVLVGNNYRKRWLVNPYYLIYFIEGIGSTYGFIIPSPGNITDGPDYTLTCFSQDSQPLYPDTTTSCEIIDLTRDPRVGKVSATLSPNPFHTSSKLEIRNLNTDPSGFVIKIYNAMGALIRSEEVSNDEVNSPSQARPRDITSYILHRSSLSDGLYFFILASNDIDYPISGKFIIQ